MNRTIQAGFLTLVLCTASAVRAANIYWDNSAGDNVYTNASNWVGDSFPASENMYINLGGNDKAVVGPGQTTLNADTLRIGYSGAGAELEQTGGTLQATSNSGAVSRFGNGSGNSGTLTIKAGSASINAIQLGLSGGSGHITISDGGLNVSRAVSDYSLIIDNDSGSSAGNFEISGGSLITRAGVKIGNNGTFKVVGNAATQIGIGSSGTSVDGRWVQDSGGTLAVRVAATATGLTKIVVDDQEASTDWNGDVTFAAGSLLEVDFAGAFTNGGTFTVMEWEGALLENGLALAPGVDTSIWSFNVDETNKRLTVTAAGAPFYSTNVTVNSISELRQYAGESGYAITMAPGTYWLTGTTDPYLLNFSGSNNTFNLTGVHIKVDTAELAGFGSTTLVNVLNIGGDGVVVDGLTLSMEKLAYNGTDAFGNPKEYCADKSSVVVVVTGSDTVIKNCEFTTGGSYPYGYGDAFGKGARPNVDGVTSAAFISHKKQSGFLITGGAGNVTVENVTLNMRSFGHGFFFQQGAHDLFFNNCQVLGDTMADSDDIIAHPEYQAWGSATYKEPIPADIRISKHEGGFRSYGNDPESNGYNQYIENVTITNCRVERMRTGVAAGANAGTLNVYDMEIVECEYGFGANAYGTTLYKNCKGDALNGPLIYFQYGVDYPATYEVELTGDTPGHGVWPIALISGVGNHITLTSSAAPGVYSKEAYVNTSQKWREWRHRPSGDLDELSTGNYASYTTGNFITNLTDQILVFGKNATGNSGCVSTGGVINKGTNNEYVGETLVPAPIIVQDTWSYPPNPTNVPWAQWDSEGNLILPTPPVTIFDGTLYIDDADALGGSPAGDGGTTVSNGTLEVASGFALQGEDLVLSGSGTAGQGAIYSDGAVANSTRLSSGSGSITLAGDTSIGVGVSGNQLLVGPIGGTGNLTKTGAGQLTLEGGANSFVGTFTVAEGKVLARSNKALNDLIILAGTTFSQNGNLALNQDSAEQTTVDGTLNLNSRGVADTGAFSVNIGSLSGAGLITATSTAATQTVNVNSTTTDSSFDGTIAGRLAVVKNGAGTTLALNGSCSHSEGTFVNAGWLGGTGSINGAVTVAPGAGIAPGNGVGTLTTGPQTWNGGAMLDVEVDASSHDVLVVNGALALGGVSCAIHLSAPDIGFDARASRSWLIVDAASVSGFSPGKFTVDASAFAANNPLDGGTFSVSESGGELHLDFTPVPYTALEEWRFQKFGTYSNAGDAADGANPDGDARDNLLEYGTGSNPNVFNSNSVATLGTTPDGTKATITFDRIADPALTYWVEAGTNLLSNDWNTIWTSTGSSNTAGPVTVEDTQSISSPWNRFLQMKLMH
ncbi:hypothetical protein PDESU_00287 [Pontiella desulfatans]|uniref:Uncharacterized protein n=1 Tax=Pontiella desulfatans TaxID=2750659 RepID=A0A6C2TWP3_PONDE|nr:autotransporter-associated beta strand repeat-containing protein [Pontiella desulfatans]VGO11741.1 hypothetical protein PDESU_00287 [Pontiella desulfatans]